MRGPYNAGATVDALGHCSAGTGNIDGLERTCWASQEPVALTDDSLKRADDATGVVDAEGLREHRTRRVDRCEGSIAQEISMLGAASRVKADDLPRAVDASGLGKGRSGHVDRREGVREGAGQGHRDGKHEGTESKHSAKDGARPMCG
jgi:hypothetical protein